MGWMTSPDDERTGRLLAAIRRRSRLRQIDLAALARVPREDVIRVEAGQVGSIPLDRTRRIFEAAGGRAHLNVWWHGAAADRILDERHAALVERALAVFQRRGWVTAPEVSFSEFGERGSIDVLSAIERHRAAAVCEVKTDFGSLEETNRVLDAKERLAPVIAHRQFGWRPSVVGRILIVPATSPIRRVVAAHEATMRSVYPARSRAVRAWLRAPSAPLRGIWFLSEVGMGDTEDG